MDNVIPVRWVEPNAPFIYCRFVRLLQTGIDSSGWYGVSCCAAPNNGEKIIYGILNMTKNIIEDVCPD